MGKALSGKLSCTGTGLVHSSFHENLNPLMQSDLDLHFIKTYNLVRIIAVRNCGTFAVVHLYGSTGKLRMQHQCF